jgi:transcriptional regulator with XRE-family HTH domain
MDKRVKKPVSSEVAARRREKFYADIADGSLTISESVVAMRKISRLTQAEFAKHRGISVQSLKQIEAGTANPTVETLQKISAIFGLEIGFVPKGSPRGQPEQPHSPALTDN